MIKHREWYLCILLLLFVLGCRNQPDTVKKPVNMPFGENPTPATFIQGYFEPEKFDAVSPIASINLYSRALTKGFYLKRKYEPIWLNKAKPNNYSKEALQLLQSSKYYGLDERDYNYQELQLLFTSLRQWKLSMADNVALASFELRLTNAMLLFISHLHQGRLNPYTLKVVTSLHKSNIDLFSVLEKSLEAEDFKSEVLKNQPENKLYHLMQKSLVKYLKNEYISDLLIIPSRKKDSIGYFKVISEYLIKRGYLNDFPDSLTNKQKSKILAGGIKKFQYFHGLEQTGKIEKSTLYAMKVPQCHRYQQMVINLERWRWENANYTANYLFVNIPAFNLAVMHDDDPVVKYRAIVGLPESPTPTLSSNLQYFIVYPEWSIPYSISSKEILPELKDNPGYLEQKNYVLLDKNNKEIDAYTIDWSKVTEKNFNYYIRQASGDDNALGLVKFIFPNKHSVYLHDTPFRKLFEKESRAYSHGCIRVQNPLMLADHLLKLDSSKITMKTLQGYIDQKITKHINLKKPLPIYIKYFTAMATNEGVFFYDDIYNLDEGLIKAFFEDEKLYSEAR